MTGFLDFNGMLAFLGGKSRAWGRLHISEIPHYRLYDRLLFSPQELSDWVTRTAVRHDPIDIDGVIAQVMQPKQKRRAAR